MESTSKVTVRTLWLSRNIIPLPALVLLDRIGESLPLLCKTISSQSKRSPT